MCPDFFSAMTNWTVWQNECINLKTHDVYYLWYSIQSSPASQCKTRPMFRNDVLAARFKFQMLQFQPFIFLPILHMQEWLMEARWTFSFVLQWSKSVKYPVLTTKTDRLKSVIAYSVGIIYYPFSISLSSAHIVWIYNMPVSVCAVSVVCVCVRESHNACIANPSPCC